MININSSLLDQAESLLDEHGIKCIVSEAPGCACLTLESEREEVEAIFLITEHFGKSAMRVSDAVVITNA